MNEELRQLIEKAAAALKQAGAREVYLFGSSAKGEMSESSDVDMAVSGLPPEEFFKAMGDAADILNRQLDLIDLDEATPFTRYLKAEGELRRMA